MALPRFPCPPQRPSPLTRRGTGWLIAFDLAALPAYTLVTFEGREVPRRTEAMMELLHRYAPLLRDPSGRLAPFLLDVRAVERPSMESLRLSLRAIRLLGREYGLILFWVDGPVGQAHYHNLLTILTPLLLNTTVQAVTSHAEALRLVRAFHARRAG